MRSACPDTCARVLSNFETRANVLFWLNVVATIIHFAMFMLVSSSCSEDVTKLDKHEQWRLELYDTQITQRVASTNYSRLKLEDGSCLVHGTCRDHLPTYRYRLQFCGLWAPSKWVTSYPSFQNCSSLAGLKLFERVCINELQRRIFECGLVDMFEEGNNEGHVIAAFRNSTFRNEFAFRWDLVPQFDVDLPVVDDGLGWTALLPAPEYIPLRALAMAFFALSMGFHLFVVWMSSKPWLGWCTRGLLSDGKQNGFYYRWMHQCRNPLRWLEYSASASIMLFVIAFFSGVRDQLLLVALTALCFCTITYGWVTEALSRPDPTSCRKNYDQREFDALLQLVYEKYNDKYKLSLNEVSQNGYTLKDKTVLLQRKLLRLLYELEVTLACEIARTQSLWKSKDRSTTTQTGQNVPTSARVTTLEDEIVFLKNCIFYPCDEINSSNGAELMRTPPTRWEINAIRSPHNIVAGGLVRLLLRCHFEGSTYQEKYQRFWLFFVPFRWAKKHSQPNSDVIDTLPVNGFFLSTAHGIAALQRLGPSLLGWVPYLTAWAIVLGTYRYSVDVLQDGAGPPAWVDAIVLGQGAVFTIFAVVQIFQQVSDYGCEHYWHGEVMYVILSFVAKTMLGMSLYVNLLTFCDGLGRLADA